MAGLVPGTPNTKGFGQRLQRGLRVLAQPDRVFRLRQEPGCLEAMLQKGLAPLGSLGGSRASGAAFRPFGGFLRVQCGRVQCLEHVMAPALSGPRAGEGEEGYEFRSTHSCLAGLTVG